MTGNVADRPAILATKIRIPRVPRSWIRRPRLDQSIDADIKTGQSVTLVSAPAGSGKTSCVAAWIESFDAHRAYWRTLDEADDAPDRHDAVSRLAAIRTTGKYLVIYSCLFLIAVAAALAIRRRR